MVSLGGKLRSQHSYLENEMRLGKKNDLQSLQHHQLSAKIHLVDINVKNRKIKLRSCFLLISYTVT